MTRYWAIAPTHYDQPQRFERVWTYAREKNIIAIGWNIGDIASMSPDELPARFAERFPGTSKHGLNQLRKFYYEIKPGDRIIARAGRKKFVGIGTVTGPAFHNPTTGQGMVGDLGVEVYENFLPVQWDDVTEKVFQDIVFGMHTVNEMPPSKFEELTTGIVDQVDDLSAQVLEETGIPPQEQGPEAQTEFVLEKYLEEFIVSNFNVVFGPDIQIYTDAEGGYGKQYRTDIGPIDILAWEPAGDSYIVMELKKGRTSDVVVGQTLRYMGWVKEHLCKRDYGEEKGVRGMIICRDWDERLEYALSVVHNMEAKFYRVDFQLSPTPFAS